MTALILSTETATNFTDHYVESRLVDDVEITSVIWKEVKILGSVIFGDHGRYCLKVRRSHTNLTYLVFDAEKLETNADQLKKYGCNAKLIRISKSWQDAIKDLQDISSPIFQPELKSAKIGDFVWKFGELWRVVSPSMKCKTSAEYARLKSAKRFCEDGRVLVQRVFDAGTTEGFFLAMDLKDSIVLVDSVTYAEWYD